MNRRQAKKILKKYGDWVPVEGKSHSAFNVYGFDSSMVLKAAAYKQNGLWHYSIPSPHRFEGFMRTYILIFLIFLLSGCAVLNQGYVHPVSGEKRICRAAGFGWLGVPLAFVMQDRCDSQMVQNGYERVP